TCALPKPLIGRPSGYSSRRSRRAAARSSATESEEIALRLRRRHSSCELVGGGGLAMPAESLKQIRPRGVEGEVPLQVQLIHQNERGSGPAQLTDGNGAVEGDDRGGSDRKQVVVQGDDLRPVGVHGCLGIRMHGIYGRLELICTGLVAAEAPAHDRLALLDQCSIPACAVLL